MIFSVSYYLTFFSYTQTNTTAHKHTYTHIHIYTNTHRHMLTHTYYHIYHNPQGGQQNLDPDLHDFRAAYSCEMQLLAGPEQLSSNSWTCRHNANTASGLKTINHFRIICRLFAWILDFLINYISLIWSFISKAINTWLECTESELRAVYLM